MSLTISKQLSNSLRRVTWRAAAQRSLSSNFYDDDEDSQRKIALVLGSSGCLGREVSRYLDESLGLQVLGADIQKVEGDTSLDAFIQLPNLPSPVDLGDATEALVQGISDVLDEDEEIDAIICASGGWMGDAPFFPESEGGAISGAREYANTVQSMLEMNLYPVLAAGYAADHFMAEEGLFVVMGATVALSPTPGMMGYGISKAGAHHFVQTLGETTGKALTTRSRRQKARRLRKDRAYLDSLSVVSILPTTIDTPGNRKAMPQANFEGWTKPRDIAVEIGTWIRKPPLRPNSGSLIKVHPSKQGGATFTLVR
eukprot:Nitzschia sp. Nitz4//scaffold57_size113557//47192//48202//NITZ4_003989-RA/size113557-augustus-gene-0.170-mRNA-1//1//CDS//3329554840//4862//frame0